MDNKGTEKAEPKQSRPRRIRPAVCSRSCCEDDYDSSNPVPNKNGKRTHFRSIPKQDSSAEVVLTDQEKRKKRRESDARCRANLSSGFDLLRDQIEHSFRKSKPLSKEMLLHYSITRIKYMEAILVLLQYTKAQTDGVAPQKPTQVLQDLHKEFLVERHGLKPDQIMVKSLSRSKQTKKKKKKKERGNAVSVSSSHQTLLSTPVKSNRPASKATISHRQHVLPDIVPSTPLSAKPEVVCSTPKNIASAWSTSPSDQVVPGSGSSKQKNHISTKKPRHGRKEVYEWSTPCKIDEVKSQSKTLIKDDLRLTRACYYKIKGKDIKPADATNMCKDCKITGGRTTPDLTCREKFTDWNDDDEDVEFMKAPQTPTFTPSIAERSPCMFTPPSLKRKMPSGYQTPDQKVPQPSTTRRKSRQCLLDRFSEEVVEKEDIITPRKKYQKRATAARARPWNQNFVQIPLQPYSGMKQWNSPKSFPNLQNVLMGTPPRRPMTALKDTSPGLQSYYKKELHSGNEKSSGYQRRSPVVVRNTLAQLNLEEDFSNSQDSVNIIGIPHLPEDISRLLHDNFNPLLFEGSPNSHSTNNLSESYDNITTDTDPSIFSMTASPYSNNQRSWLLQDILGDRGDLDLPKGASVLSPKSSSGLSDIIDVSVEDGVISLSDAAVASKALGGCTSWKTAWKGKRDDDITLAQLQRQPPLGGKTPSTQTTNSPGEHMPLYPLSDEELIPGYLDILHSPSEGESLSSSMNLDLYDNGSSSQEGMSESPSPERPFSLFQSCTQARHEDYQVVPPYYKFED